MNIRLRVFLFITVQILHVECHTVNTTNLPHAENQLAPVMGQVG